MRNVHARALPVPAAVAGQLLDRLGRPGDPLWPSPEWPPMVLSGPLAVGVTGGHGPIRYAVTGHEPGRSVEFTFAPGVGLSGTHTFTVEPAGPDSCVLRHVLAGRLRGPGRVAWPLAVRWLHDAVLEDLLDRAESSLGVGPARPARWSSWVRALRRGWRLSAADDGAADVAVPGGGVDVRRSAGTQRAPAADGSAPRVRPIQTHVPSARARCTEIAGWLAVAFGALHVGVAPLDHRAVWSQAAAEGLWNSFTLARSTTLAEAQRSEAFWVTVGSFGVPILTLGCLVVWATRQHHRVPAWIGWIVLAWGLFFVTVLPASPGWVVPLIGGLIILGDPHRRRSGGASRTPAAVA